MPETLASFSRAPGFSVYLLKSNSTSDMFTIRPRADSWVSRIMFNCWRSRCRAVPFGLDAAILVHLGLLGGLARQGLRTALTLRGGGAFLRQLFFVDFPQGYDARVLGHLGGLPRIGLGSLAVFVFAM